jgi:hypothetical protein
MTQRTSIENLELQSNASNLARARARIDREKAEAAPLAPGRKGEIQQLDELIIAALKACRRQSLKGKTNPAFQNLSTLVKLRANMLKENPPANSTEDAVSDLKQFIAKGRSN